MVGQQKKGLLIVFEGTDGTGKSTQLQLLASNLEKRNYPVITTREPTTGEYGQKIRHLYVNRDQVSREEELELFIADRKDHVRNLLIPALNEGKIILCDRYFLSTAAYQGAMGIDPEKILTLNDFAPDPDLALLFQVPIETGLNRITASRGDTPNDFEQHETLLKVAAIFSSIDRPYIQVIDATGSIEQVHGRVVQQVTPLLSTFSSSTED